MKRILTFLPLLALLASCSGRSSQLLADLNAHRWELVRLTIDGLDEDLSAVGPEGRSLAFDGTRGFGTAGVNHFEMVVEVEAPDRIRAVGGFGMTEMAGHPELTKLEETYYGNLVRIETAIVTGSTLVMTSPKARLTFRGHPPHPPFTGDPEEPDSISR